MTSVFRNDSLFPVLPTWWQFSVSMRPWQGCQNVDDEILALKILRTVFALSNCQMCWSQSKSPFSLLTAQALPQSTTTGISLVETAYRPSLLLAASDDSSKSVTWPCYFSFIKCFCVTMEATYVSCFQVKNQLGPFSGDFVFFLTADFGKHPDLRISFLKLFSSKTCKQDLEVRQMLLFSFSNNELLSRFRHISSFSCNQINNKVGLSNSWYNLGTGIAFQRRHIRYTSCI